MQIVKHTSNQIAATQTAANLEIAAAHAANAHAKNTNRSYKNDLKLVSAFFPNFVNETFQVVTPLTATDVENFIGHLIRTGYTKNGIQQVYKPSSLEHILNTISSTHKAASLDSPINKTVRAIVTGYGKTLTDNKPYKQKQRNNDSHDQVTKLMFKMHKISNYVKGLCQHQNNDCSFNKMLKKAFIHPHHNKTQYQFYNCKNRQNNGHSYNLFLTTSNIMVLMQNS